MRLFDGINYLSDFSPSPLNYRSIRVTIIACKREHFPVYLIQVNLTTRLRLLDSLFSSVLVYRYSIIVLLLFPFLPCLVFVADEVLLVVPQLPGVSLLLERLVLVELAIITLVIIKILILPRPTFFGLLL